MVYSSSVFSTSLMCFVVMNYLKRQLSNCKPNWMELFWEKWMANMSSVSLLVCQWETPLFSKCVPVDTFSFIEYQFSRGHFVPQNSQWAYGLYKTWAPWLGEPLVCLLVFVEKGAGRKMSHFTIPLPASWWRKWRGRTVFIILLIFFR